MDIKIMLVKNVYLNSVNMVIKISGFRAISFYINQRLASIVKIITRN